MCGASVWVSDRIPSARRKYNPRWLNRSAIVFAKVGDRMGFGLCVGSNPR
ncbi:MAG: hypothetical protein HC852_11200 [Acaryochloridaceae cyanobacterium RU_4_10]|nr:hypothetical protein [Acaryochloridaceae cyanobacterium RU_4_10]